MTIPERMFSRTGMFVAWALLVVALLPVREVMPPDEPRFAHQAQSMKSSGDWIVPHIGDAKNVDKPPVLFWSVALASLPLDRVTATTSRVPSALASLIVLLLVARMGRRLWGSDAIAYGGALVTLTGIEFFQKAEWCSCDMTLAAFTWIAITLWSEAAFGDPPPGRRWLRIALGWTAVGFGILTKGPVALLWPLFWVIAEAVARRRFRPLARLVVNPGVFVMLAIVGGWLYALGERAGWDFVYEATIHQNLDRYAKAWNSVQPWWFFVYQTPADLFWWAGFLPAAIALAMRRGSVASRTAGLFALFGICFFSTSSGKRGVYVMEAFPAISLLITAAVLQEGFGAIGFVVMAVIGLILGIAAPIALASGAVHIPAALAAASGIMGLAGLVIVGLALAIGGAYGLRLLRRGRNQPALAVAVAGTFVALFLAGTVGGTTWSRMQRARPFCASMDAAAPKGERIAVEGTKFEQFMFYTLRSTDDFDTDEQLVTLLASGRCRYAILLRQRYDRMRGADPVGSLALLAEGAISEKDYVLVGPPDRR
jgi:4-amino-4-deoxy-L-arabinose transferase-like glycosyltransferase